MTFTEAAAHVLRLVGKPLHYKEITDVAIERDLLSHVGKSPEVTMGARLAAVVKKDPKDNPLVRVKPGVFALRDWDQSVIDSGLADRTPALERIAKLEVTHGADESESASETPEAASVLGSLSPDGDEIEAASAYPDSGFDADEDEDIGDDERERAELAAAATELFVPEDDDDEPILGGEAETDSADRSDAPGKRRRRRRRRGGRSGLEEDNGLPSYTVSDAPILSESEDDAGAAPRGGDGRRGAEGRAAEARGDAGERRNGEGRAEGRAFESRGSEGRGEGRGFEGREGRGAEGRGPEGRGPEGRGAEGRGSEGRGEGRGFEGRGSEGRGEGREGRGSEGRGSEGRGEGREGRSSEGRGEGRGTEGRGFEARASEARASEGGRGVEDLAVPSILTLLEQLLPPRSRSGAIPIRQLAEQGIRRVRAKIEPQALQDAIADAVRFEVVRARTERRRPRFTLHGRAVSSTDWGMDAEVVRLEKELASVATRYREAFQKSFGERLTTLQPRALGDFFTLLLSQIGFENIEPVRRQGAHNQELHFSAVARSATGDVPTAIIVRRDGRDIGRERVIDLRGALHHYNGAMAGLLATTGQVMSGAREEARVPNAAPVTLFDGPSLSKLSAQHGVGVAFSELRLPMLDIELLDSLTAG